MTPVVKSLLVLLLAAASIALPALAAPEPEPPAAVDTPAAAFCPVEEGSERSTTVDAVSTAVGPLDLTTFSAGVVTGTAQVEIGGARAASIPITDVAAVGTGAALVEPPTADAAAAAVFTGDISLSVDTCVAAPSSRVILGGGSTLDGHDLQVQLMNPYAGEAVADLVVQSDAGLESNSELEAVLVPPRSSVIVDLGELLPGRVWMNVTIEVAQGGLIATGREAVGGDDAVWHAVTPAEDWYIPVPHGLESHNIVIAADDSPVEYQIDVYTPDGLVEAHSAGEIDGRGRAVIDVAAITPVASAIRVVSTGPVAAFLRIGSSAGIGLSSGASFPAVRWLLPGAGAIFGGTGSVVILNPGLEDVNASVTALRAQPATSVVAVPAGEVVEVAIATDPAIGYEVEGDGQLVVGWSMTRGGSIALGGGAPLSDG